MKFALRDDDLNFFYKPEVIENNYKDIWDICPVSMSVVPYIQGNWPKNVLDFEKRGPGFFSEDEIEHIMQDDKIYKIDENFELVEYIKNKISERKIYLMHHSMHHRNHDYTIPNLSSNFGINAEFYTTRDLTNELRESIEYLEKLFCQKIEVFIAPQNIITANGLRAVLNNSLAICITIPSIHKFSTFNLLGVKNYCKYIFFKFFNHDLRYPFPISNNRLKIIDHYSLGVNTDLEQLYNKLMRIEKLNGNFVLATHSYGFNFKMQKYNMTLGDALCEIIDNLSKNGNVKFVSVNEIFKIK